MRPAIAGAGHAKAIDTSASAVTKDFTQYPRCPDTGLKSLAPDT
jgi:hypothetical protein